jgi:hypothetical protein
MTRVLTFRTSGILAHLAERLGTGTGTGTGIGAVGVVVVVVVVVIVIVGISHLDCIEIDW